MSSDGGIADDATTEIQPGSLGDTIAANDLTMPEEAKLSILGWELGSSRPWLSTTEKRSAAGTSAHLRRDRQSTSRAKVQSSLPRSPRRTRDSGYSSSRPARGEIS